MNTGEHAIQFFDFFIDFSLFMRIFVSDLCDASSPERRTLKGSSLAFPPNAGLFYSTRSIMREVSHGKRSKRKGEAFEAKEQED
jgi:hypothetical protein